MELTGENACLVTQQPNFFGYFEDAARLDQHAKQCGALFVVACDPVSLGLFRPPGDYGADIVVAEGQSLGAPMSFGGPYLGIFATRERYVRRCRAGSWAAPVTSTGGPGTFSTASDPGAAHPPRTRDVEYLLERATRRAGGDGLSLCGGVGGASAGGGAVLSQGALRGGRDSVAARATRFP